MEQRFKGDEQECLFFPDKATFQNILTSLPLVTYQAGETVIADGSRTGRLLILRKGNVAILKKGHGDC